MYYKITVSSGIRSRVLRPRGERANHYPHASFIVLHQQVILLLVWKCLMARLSKTTVDRIASLFLSEVRWLSIDQL